MPVGPTWGEVGPVLEGAREAKTRFSLGRGCIFEIFVELQVKIGSEGKLGLILALLLGGFGAQNRPCWLKIQGSWPKMGASWPIREPKPDEKMRLDAPGCAWTRLDAPGCGSRAERNGQQS